MVLVHHLSVGAYFKHRSALQNNFVVFIDVIALLIHLRSTVDGLFELLESVDIASLVDGIHHSIQRTVYRFVEIISRLIAMTFKCSSIELMGRPSVSGIIDKYLADFIIAGMDAKPGEKLIVAFVVVVMHVPTAVIIGLSMMSVFHQLIIGPQIQFVVEGTGIINSLDDLLPGFRISDAIHAQASLNVIAFADIGKFFVPSFIDDVTYDFSQAHFRGNRIALALDNDFNFLLG